eukprot:2014821-Pleurochrysis_carterae.AAC.1
MACWMLVEACERVRSNARERRERRRWRRAATKRRREQGSHCVEVSAAKIHCAMDGLRRSFEATELEPCRLLNVCASAALSWSALDRNAPFVEWARMSTRHAFTDCPRMTVGCKDIKNELSVQK